MSNLVEFLLARIAEDEAVARAIMAEGYSEGHWQWDMHRNAPYRSALVDERGRVLLPPKDDDVFPSQNVAVHIARHDPRRVLAECEAKRRIVEWITVEYVDRTPTSKPGVWDVVRTREPADDGYAEEVLLAMAQPYAAHPDFREEWRP